MKSIIDKLWDSDITPGECGVYSSPELKEILKKSSEYYRELTESLTDRQKELLSGFIDKKIKYHDIAERMIFEYGFCLGANTIIDIVSYTEEKEGI